MKLSVVFVVLVGIIVKFSVRMNFQLLLTLAKAFASPAKHGKFLNIDKIEVDTDPEFIKVKSSVEVVDGIGGVNMDMDVLKDESDVGYKIVVFRHNVDHYEHFYKSDMVSGCTGATMKDPVLLFIFKESMKYGNITAACPLKIGHYELRGFKIENSDLPHGQLPAGSYRFDFSAHVKDGGEMKEIYIDKYYFTTD